MENILNGYSDDYKKWMFIQKQNPNLCFTPTMEIDEEWHTHLSNNKDYEDFCESYLGKKLLHNENILDDDRKEGFNNLKKLWFENFNVELSGTPAMCGSKLV